MKDAEGRYIFTNRPNPEWAKPGVSIIGKFDSDVQLDKIWPDNAAVRIWMFWPLARK